MSEQDRERFRAIGGYRQFDKNETKALIKRAGFDKPGFDKVLELIPPPESKPGKELFDKYLMCASQSKELTPDEWCAMGVCPECIHDMNTCADGQFCPECGYFTELPYVPPAERES